MSTQTLPAPVRTRERRTDRSVHEIISAARAVQQPGRATAHGAWILSGLTALLLWASFAPVDFGPLAWLALVPLVLLVRLERPTRRMYTAAFCCGWLNTLACLQWMRLGDITMYPAWWALSCYMALYFPLFLAVSRVAVHRLSIPLTVAVPVVWVALEFVRAKFLTGFAWYFLSHTQYRWIELIQVSDLIGAYGVSFLVAMGAACLAGLIPAQAFAKLRLLPASTEFSLGYMERRQVRGFRPVLNTLACLLVIAAALAYGYVRRGQAEFREGPRVALVQGNFPVSMKQDPRDWADIYRTHDYLTGLTVQHQPDLIVWPETMFRWPLITAPADMSEDELRAAAPQIPIEFMRDTTVRQTLVSNSRKAGAAMVVGVDAFDIDREGMKHYNAAVFVQPEGGISGRYDKLHRVPFGEYIPLQESVPLLQVLSPIPPELSIQAGERLHVFRYGDWRFAPIICFEDTVPHLVRSIVRGTTSSETGRRVDCLVNLTNDGWFKGSSELDQHLITAVFRCVECRTPMVRAVNTGVSAVIDGDGVVVEPEVFVDGDRHERTTLYDPSTGRWRKSLNAGLVHPVPLDDRASFYVLYGDWFAGTCCLFAGVFALAGCLRKPARDEAIDSRSDHLA